MELGLIHIANSSVADLTVGGLGGRRRFMGPVDRHSIVCRKDRVLATRAPGRMAVGDPMLANLLLKRFFFQLYHEPGPIFTVDL